MQLCLHSAFMSTQLRNNSLAASFDILYDFEASVPAQRHTPPPKKLYWDYSPDSKSNRELVLLITREAMPAVTSTCMPWKHIAHLNTRQPFALYFMAITR